MTVQQSLTAACVQLNSCDSIDDNLSQIQKILSAHKPKLDIIVLPENATLISNDITLKRNYAKPEAYQTVFETLSSMAKSKNAWLIAGTLLIKDEQHPDKMFNHCPVFAPDGTLVTSYNKMHLFDADLGSESWLESSQISPGTSPAIVGMNQHWHIGLSICYDLRFPELYRHYSNHQCNIMTVPASFTVPTGKAHWETLLRARAIENQCYVLAAGQWGKHSDGRQTYGHSMIIDPWGETLAKLDEGTGIITAELSLERLSSLQQRMPVLQHRRLP